MGNTTIHSDVNAISQLFVMKERCPPLKASPDCWNAWTHGSGSHGWSGGPRPPVSLMINTHIHNYCSPQRGKVRGRVAWESMICLFTFSAGWVDVRSWGLLRTDQMFGVRWLTKALLYQSVWMCVHFRKCLYWLLFLVNSVKKEKSKINVFKHVSSNIPPVCYWLD